MTQFIEHAKVCRSKNRDDQTVKHNYKKMYKNGRLSDSRKSSVLKTSRKSNKEAAVLTELESLLLALDAATGKALLLRDDR